MKNSLVLASRTLRTAVACAAVAGLAGGCRADLPPESEPAAVPATAVDADVGIDGGADVPADVVADSAADATDGSSDVPSDSVVDSDSDSDALADTLGDVGEEIATDVPVDAGPDAPVDTVADAPVDTVADASMDAAFDAAIDAISDVGVDAAIEVSSDVKTDSSGDAATDAANDSAADAAIDIQADVATDAVADSAPDNDVDAAGDTVVDTAVDVAPDVPADAAPDAGPKCEPGKCDDGNVCTDDLCDPAVGCSYSANTGPCSAGSACSVGDQCSDSKCVAGAPKLFNMAYGGSLNENARAIAAVTNGFAVAGYAASTNLDGGAKSAGDTDFWLVRTDSAGKLLWSKTYGGSTNGELANALVSLPDGFALAGEAWSTDLPGVGKSAGLDDFWLVRTDTDGKMLWAQVYGGTGNESASGLAALQDGFALAGFSSSATLPGGAKPNLDKDAWLVRTNSVGELQWSVTYGGSADDRATAVAVLADGSYALAGYTSSADLPGGQKSVGFYDSWLIRADATGKLLWSRTYGGSGYELAHAVTVTQDGGFLLAGSAGSKNLPGGQKSAGGSDAWLVRTNAAGDLLWSKTYGDYADDVATAVNALPDGGFVFGGYTNSLAPLPGGPKSSGGYDFWLTRVDAIGNVLWSRTYGTAKDEQPGERALAPLADGGFGLAGHTAAKGAGGSDYWLIRTDAWGHAGCGEAGSCAGKNATGCDDGNSCTADFCEGTLGCTHDNLPDWSVCGAGKVCDGKGACGDVKVAKAMAYVPPGTFWMGCNVTKDKDCAAEPASSEKPQHQVTLSGYYIDTLEVTTAKWLACVDAKKCSVPDAACSALAVGNWSGTAPKLGRELHPVNCISWNQADAYCSWRGGSLPTEAQWEMAARGSCDLNGGTATCGEGMRIFPWGDTSPSCTEAQMFGGGLSGCGANTSAPVGSKPKGNSPYAVMDMAGNVWEWTADWYQGSYDAGPASDPKGPATANARVSRGGGFGNTSAQVRSSGRNPNVPTYFDYDIGFRCARSYP